ncbi:MAG: tetraacyldisaccharide 4'-kinase [Gemmatimonadota bacterium]
MIPRSFLSARHAGVHAAAEALYRPPGAGGRAAAAILLPVSAVYGRLSALRSAAAHASRVRLTRPVLSVGNVGLGGTGKTPFVRWLAWRLREGGHEPAVLMRGHGAVRRSHPPLALLPPAPDAEAARVASARPLPDEALLFLRDRLAVGAHPSRARAAAALVRAGARPDAFLLDDGLQHRWLHRDWDLALVSTRELRAPRRALPAGPLREPPTALGRAHRIAVTGLLEAEARELAGRTCAELGLAGRDPAALPVLAGLELAGVVGLEAWWEGALPAAAAGHGALILFSGVADPGSFERLVQQGGLRASGHVVFPDHHRFTAAELRELAARAAPGGTLLTTGKDAARLPPAAFAPGACLVAVVRLRVWQGEDELLADVLRVVDPEGT